MGICPGGGAIPSSLVIALVSLATLEPVAPASAAGPGVGATWASKVESRSAVLSAEINPQGSPTSGYFEYATQADFQAKGFAGAKKVNLNNIGSGSGTSTIAFPVIAGLAPDTTYRYRLTVSNGGGQTISPPTPPYQLFHTQPLGGGSVLLDARGWEMVSPVDKNGGQVAAPGQIAAGGVMQAAAAGSVVTYSSSASFAGGAGAPPASQYLATRGAGGWQTQNLTVPIFSGSYDTANGGAPYRLFSPDLASGLLLSGKRCRGEATSGCPLPNPTLPGTDAPAGYQDYYLRNSASGAFEALLGSSDVAGMGLDPTQFELRLAGASPDLAHVVLATCSKLTAAAIDGCPGEENLYEWSAGSGLALVNAAPGASLAAQAGAVSTDGSRVYFYSGGDLLLRDGASTKQADADAGGGGTFQLAIASGSLAYFTKVGHVYRYAAADAATDITPSGGVEGVLGAAADGSHLYYLTDSGLYLCASANLTGNCETSATKVAADADADDYPPATGTSRVSADGTKLGFVATAPLTGYDNTDLITGQPDSQVYLYDASGSGTLTCVSCNPTNARPVGPSSIPGAITNGAGPTATISYKPRALSANGRRLFFGSADALALTDVNRVTGTGEGIGDAYEWEAQGEGNCTRVGGCLSLISSGRDPAPSLFADASVDGSDAFFLTEASLVGADLGGADLYDARIGGGFAEPPPPIACNGDSCQVLPPEPIEPTLTTLLEGPGNPAVHYTRYKHRFKKLKKHHRRHGHHHGRHKQRSGR